MSSTGCKKIKLDKKSDVYSLVALFWEFTSGIPPFNRNNLFDIFTKILNNEREEAIVCTPSCYANFFNKCWSFERNQRLMLNDILTELERLSKEKTVEFITNIIDSDSETSIYSENLVEFITNVDDYSETSICLEDFVLSNDSDHQSMLFENISTLFKNKNTYDEEDFGNNLIIVLQYANGGTLRSYLRSKINENIFIISRAEIILITKQIISGLQSLHDNKVIHRNLNPENILIVRDDNMASIYEKSFNIAIDFGSADDSLTSAFSTIEYEDLQFLINTRGPTCKSDIYSLEVILCELTSGIRPYSKYNNKFVLAYYISKGLREKIIPGMPSSYSRLYKKCWSTNPKKRPELQKILHEIHKIQQNGKDIYKDISNEIPHVHC
ncbi:kinase-like domain-containing protein [Gigaspora rosea]|uniref:Kinase-like domain-containing protein n=1 Tax=Gigaspora rosea TaxID=44941 RepID=A0A397UAD6_9GLOM|nr:kinase-like domain-containing protein [Gigaspora rosea]